MVTWDQFFLGPEDQLRPAKRDLRHSYKGELRPCKLYYFKKRVSLFTDVEKSRNVRQSEICDDKG